MDSMAVVVPDSYQREYFGVRELKSQYRGPSLIKTEFGLVLLASVHYVSVAESLE